MKRKNLKLETLKVKSFVTLNMPVSIETIKGGRRSKIVMAAPRVSLIPKMTAAEIDGTLRF